jgi:hypothetical protein
MTFSASDLDQSRFGMSASNVLTLEAFGRSREEHRLLY